MSTSLRAAIAAKRAELKQTSPVKKGSSGNLYDATTTRSGSADESDAVDDISITPFGSPKKSRPTRLDAEEEQEVIDGLTGALDGLELGQKEVDDLLAKSCQTGRLNISSRAPGLREIPSSVFTLLGDTAPAWYEAHANRTGSRRPWYERADITTLQASNNELRELDPRVADFGALTRLTLNNNKLLRLPSSLAHLDRLISLNLSRNSLTVFPTCLLALPNLVELDLSYNHVEKLWDEGALQEANEAHDKWIANKEDAEEGGVWAGLVRGSGSRRRGETAGPSSSSTAAPLPKLRSLSLVNNRLQNAALGIAKGQPRCEAIRWPPALTQLDLSENRLMGPFPLYAFGELTHLETLGLGSNGVADHVFAKPSPEDPEAGPSKRPEYFASLKTLDLHCCEIDDLAPLEAAFGSPRTIAEGEKPHLAGLGTPEPIEGVGKRYLVRVIRIGQEVEDSFSTAPSGSGQRRRLALFLDGNALREEIYRRKRGAAAGPKARTVSAGVVAAAEANGFGGASAGRDRQPPPALETRGEDLEPPPEPTKKKSPASAEEAMADPWAEPSASRRAKQPPADEWGPLGGVSSPSPRKKGGLLPAKLKARAQQHSDSEPCQSAVEAPAPSPSTRGRGDVNSSSFSLGASAATDEPWEPHISEGAKRRMRAEAARKAREAELAAEGGGGGSNAA